MATIYWKMTADASHNNDYILYLRNTSASGYTAWTTTSTGQTTAGWYYATGRTDIYKVVIETAIAPTTCYYWFNDCTKLETIQGLSNLNTSSVGNMMYMFNDCRALTVLDVSGFNTSNVTTMCGMFSFCKSLTSLDVSNFNTANVTNMKTMFESCELLTSIDVSSFNTSNVTDMSFMFNQCFLLTSLDLSNFDTSKVTDMLAMFQSCRALTLLDVSNFNTSSVTDMRSMFNGCNALTSLDVSNFNTASVTDMQSMFSGCHALTSLDLSNFDTSSVTNISSMFSSCYALESVNITMSNSITDMGYCFAYCRSLVTAPVAIPQNVTNVNGCFRECISLVGNIEVYNTPTSYTNTFTKTENDIYIIYRGHNISQAWTDIASQYSNIHYEANDNTIPSLSMRVIRVSSSLSETPSELGEYAYISAMAIIYSDYLPVGWTDSFGTKTLTNDGTTISPTWTQTSTDNTYTLKCWVSLGDITKHTFTLQVTDDIKDANNTTKATHQSLLVTQSLSKAYKLVDYYHESDPNSPNYDTEGMSIGKYATEANLFDVDMPAIFRDTTTCQDLAVNGDISAVGDNTFATGNTEVENPFYSLDTSAPSGTDHDLYAAVTALGWDSDVIANLLLDVKKLLTKILTELTNKSNELVTESQSASVSLPASDATNVDVDMTKSGYKLISIASVETSGTGSTLGWISSFRMLNATTVRVSFRNSTNAARSYTLIVTGLYIKE